jgi:Copper transport outer membrane protein, MctB
MINLRYHIVSITAVFLALGIGVALGSTLIERATVDTLSGRLDEQSERLDRTDGENAQLRDELDVLAERQRQLTEQGASLYAGHLTGVPTVVLTTQGTDDELVALTQRSLRSAESDLYGTLRLTSRWESLSQEEVTDLAELLDRALVRGPQTRQATLEALAAELLAASQPAPAVDEIPPVDTPTNPQEPVGDGQGDAAGDTGSTTTASGAADGAEQAEPSDEQPDTTDEQAVSPGDGVGGTPILTGLIERGYVEFLADGSNVPLPEFGARYVLVVDASTDVGVEDVVVPLVELMAEAVPAPLVVAEPLAEVETEEDEVQPPLAGPVVTAVRTDEDLALRVTTTDSPGVFIGQSAIVLGVADLVADPTRVGQYGIAVGAVALLPPPEE